MLRPRHSVLTAPAGETLLTAASIDRAGQPAPGNPLNRAAWEACSFDPDCPPPDELIRLPVPDSAWGALITTATDVRRDVPRAGRHRPARVPDRELAGWESVKFAEFFLLTGQTARLRTLDDAGPALAMAYESIGELTRTALRAAVTGSGELDLVRAVGGPWSPTVPDGDALVRELADRADWPRLWGLATRLPLADAVAVARQVAGRWQPPETAARPLFNLLSQADPEVLAAPAPVRLRTDAESRSCSFSMDGRWAAVTVLSSGQNVTFGHTLSGQDLSAGADLTVDWLLFRLPDGTLVERTRRAGVLYDARWPTGGRTAGTGQRWPLMASSTDCTTPRASGASRRSPSR